jgi:hypothetical protein
MENNLYSGNRGSCSDNKNPFRDGSEEMVVQLGQKYDRGILWLRIVWVASKGGRILHQQIFLHENN